MASRPVVLLPVVLPMLRQLRHGRCARSLLLLLCCGALSTAPAPRSDVFEAIDQWLVAYRKGRIHLSGTRKVEGSLAVVLGLLDPDRDRVRVVDELEALVSRAAEEGGPAAARRLLQLASVGLDRHRYSASMLPTRVRLIGEGALLRCASVESRHFVLQVATGDQRFLRSDDQAEAVQSAALRALGAYREPVFRPALEGQLNASSPRIRTAAAEGLLRLRSPASLRALIDRLETEKKAAPLRAIAEATTAILRPHRDGMWPPRLVRATRAAGKALERGSWRSDHALVDLLEVCRRAESVPPLIQVLQRFARKGRTKVWTELSGLLRERAHRALVSLTGMRHPADKPSDWRYYWSRVRHDFEAVAEGTQPHKAEGPDFFGLPIHGTSVLFAVDLSGSMAFPFRGGETRLQAVQDALSSAISELPESTSFDLVCFAKKTWRWSGQMQPATKANKRRCVEFVRAMDAEGGTNTWGALTQAMHLHARPYGKPCNLDVDELFLLSDGIPTVGHVIDAQAILQLVAAGNPFHSVRVNTVYLAPTLTHRDEEGERKMGMRARDFMKQLAEENGGRFSEQF